MITTGFNILITVIVISVALVMRYNTKSEEDIYDKKGKKWGKK